jgi:hypothetical protein
MNKIIYTLAFLLIAAASQAQCPGCVVDPSCTANPVAPALCPSTLPDAPVNVPFDLDVTFFMPQNFTDAGTGFDVTLSAITITSIGGLPPGLAATVNEADNVYTITSDPASQRGCVKICGTPTAIGSYTISVNVIASVSSPISIDQAQSFTLPILVTPGSSGNSGFSISIDAGCDSLLTQFQALITSPTQPVEYAWDFGNGNTSTLANPEPQLYTVPDTYTVTLETRLMDFILTNVNFTATGSNWCGDIEEPSIPFVGTCTGSPDIYYQLTIGGSTQTSSSGNNSTNFSQSGMNTVISGTAFSIQFYDDDNVSQDDNLGTAVIQFTGPGNYNFTTNEGFGSLSIGTQASLIFNNSDTVTVYTSPESPDILVSQNTFCIGDSALLSLPEAAFYQWYNDAGAILSANNDSLWVFGNGTFYGEIRNPQGCAAVSDTVSIAALEYPIEPVIFFNPVTETFIYNPGLPYTWIWLLNGDTLQGTENLTSYVPTQPGDYSVVVSENDLCFAYSQSLPFTNVGIQNINTLEDAEVWPQPLLSEFLNVRIPKSASGAAPHFKIYNLRGSETIPVALETEMNVWQLDLSRLSSGVYILMIENGSQVFRKRIQLIR